MLRRLPTCSLSSRLIASEKKPKAMSFVSAGVQSAGSRPGDEIDKSGVVRCTFLHGASGLLRR